MIRVGFFLNFPIEYKGGVNYYKNLFLALKRHYKSEIQIVLFVPKYLRDEYVDIFKPYALIVKTPTLDRKSFPWFISTFCNRILKTDFLTKKLVQRNQIDIASYCCSYFNIGTKIKSLNWLPDFQSLHYPHFWTEKQLKQERQLLKECVAKSDRILLSSFNAFDDYRKIFPDVQEKVRVVHFVSQPEMHQLAAFDASKYAERPFFYLPNQFWEHKNHIVVFKAVKLLVKRRPDILLLTSGLMKDYRSGDRYIESLLRYVSENDLGEYIRFLGLIPYADVNGLLQNALAVINPSKFEGWSSTVEESKSINQTILLSDIPVHREQAPATGHYFKTDDEYRLADLMEDVMQNPRVANKQDAHVSLLKRTEVFANNYYKVLKELYLGKNDAFV